MANLPFGKTALSYTGSEVSYDITEDGYVFVELWGGAGGQTYLGSTTTASGYYAGHGGYTVAYFPVSAGDVVKVQVASGGGNGVLDAGFTAQGGLGGYPDGGDGGRRTTTNTATAVVCGAGGGSTRVYKNNVLMALAAGGGGSAAATSTGGSGSGGGALGYTATGTGGGGGGTQSAAGAGGSGAGQFSGGGGVALGQTRDTAQTSGGPGGGGGYYGGGGSTGTAGGGGGSSYINTAAGVVGRLVNHAHHGTLAASIVKVAPGLKSPNYVANIAKGNGTIVQNGTNGVGSRGGDGRAVLMYTKADVVVPGGGTSPVNNVVPVTTVAKVRMWGAGGGGNNRPTVDTNQCHSAPGGFTEVYVPVEAGDILQIRPGQGGRGASFGASNPQANGGYPDGGAGGARTGSNVYYGGGGGSTRLYKNNVLIAVAGAGAGASGRVMDTESISGAGGGASGGSGTGTFNTTAVATGTGGSQSAGGINLGYPTSVNQSGTQTRGGNGWRDTFTADSANAGSGGGGGYWGGGASSGDTSNTPVGAGGGSGYYDPSAVKMGQTVAGSGYTPGNSSDPFYPVGWGMGVYSQMQNTATFGATGAPWGTPNGMDGIALIEYLTPLNAAVVNAPALGRAAEYAVTADGKLEVEAWGGAGGGGFYPTARAGRKGGAGGYTGLKIDPVVIGDVIKVETGGGGKKSGVALLGGDAGWPDGGYGGRTSVANASMPGGGGSSRVYLNGVLIAVAGGGGGSSGYYHGGAGGGTTGGLGDAAETGTGGAGTQSAGGAGAPTGALTAASFRGANGGPNQSTTASNIHAPGGGGGYYGGGTNSSRTNPAAQAGGGGSGYLLSRFDIIDGVTSTGVADTGTPPDPNGTKPAGVAEGGVSSATQATVTNGGDGNVRLRAIGLEIPADVSGDLGTVTLTSPAAVARVPNTATAQAFENNLVITPMDGVAGQTVDLVIDSLPGISLLMFLNVTGEASAIINTVVSDTDIVLSAPAPTPGASVQVTKTFPGPIRFTPPRAINEVALVTDPFPEIIMISPEGIGELAEIAPITPFENSLVLSLPPPFAAASGGLAISRPISSATLTPPAGTATGAKTAEAEALAFANDIVLSTPEATAVEGVDGFAAGLLGTLTLIQPEALAGTGAIPEPFEHDITFVAPAATAQEVPVVEATGLPILYSITTLAPEGSAVEVPVVVATGGAYENALVLTAPEGEGHNGEAVEGVSEAYENPLVLTAPEGEAHERFDMIAVGDVIPPVLVQNLIVPDIEAGAQLNPARQIITLTPALGAAGGGLTVDADDIPTITMIPATGIAFYAVYVIASILPARITMSAPQGIGYEGGVAFAFGDLYHDGAFLTFTAPEAVTQIVPEATFEPIVLDYVDGYVEVDRPAFAPLRLLRSTTPGAVPVLGAQQIAINEHDAVLYSRNGAGEVVGTPFKGFARGQFAPAGGSAGQVLTAGGLWTPPEPVETTPALLKPPQASQIMLATDGLSLSTAVPGRNLVFYRPFFVPKSTEITHLAAEVLSGGASTLHMGVCRWNPAGTPLETVVSGQISAATSGLKSISAPATLEAGWYASMFAVQGLSNVTMRVQVAPATVAADFSLLGDATAPFGGSLAVPPAPTARASDAWTFVQGITA